jgi:hypothetical protein
MLKVGWVFMDEGKLNSELSCEGCMEEGRGSGRGSY